jgi:hypothetical protein
MVYLAMEVKSFSTHAPAVSFYFLLSLGSMREFMSFPYTFVSYSVLLHHFTDLVNTIFAASFLIKFLIFIVKDSLPDDNTGTAISL